MALDKSKITRADVALLRECGFDVSSNNIVFSMRAAAREIAKLRAVRRIDLLERLRLVVISTVVGSAVTLIIGMVLR